MFNLFNKRTAETAWTMAGEVVWNVIVLAVWAGKAGISVAKSAMALDKGLTEKLLHEKGEWKESETAAGCPVKTRKVGMLGASETYYDISAYRTKVEEKRKAEAKERDERMREGFKRGIAYVVKAVSRNPGTYYLAVMKDGTVGVSSERPKDAKASFPMEFRGDEGLLEIYGKLETSISKASSMIF